MYIKLMIIKVVKCDKQTSKNKLFAKLILTLQMIRFDTENTKYENTYIRRYL